MRGDEFKIASERSALTTDGKSLMNIKVGKEAIAEASRKLSNWGRWGKDDQIGTLNHVRPEDIVQLFVPLPGVKAVNVFAPADCPHARVFGAAELARDAVRRQCVQDFRAG